MYRTSEDERRALLTNYHTWLNLELRHLNQELGKSMDGALEWNNVASMYHWVAYGEPPAPLPSERAAMVLDAIDCDWRSEVERLYRRETSQA